MRSDDGDCGGDGGGEIIMDAQNHNTEGQQKPNTEDPQKLRAENNQKKEKKFSWQKFWPALFTGVIIAAVPVIYNYLNDSSTRKEHKRQEQRELLDSALSECEDYRTYLRKLSNDPKATTPDKLITKIAHNITFDSQLYALVYPFIQTAISLDSIIQTHNNTLPIGFNMRSVDTMNIYAIKLITEKYREVATQ